MRTFEDGRIRHLYETRPCEVVVIAPRTEEYVYWRGGEATAVTLDAGRATILDESAALQFVREGVEIVDRDRGELPRRTRLLPQPPYWPESEVLASRLR